MHRIATLRGVSLLTCSLLVAVAAVAAPTPVFKPSKVSHVWVTGWDQPMDLPKGCRFDRKGDKFTITLPKFEENIGIQFAGLSRTIEDDFAMQARVQRYILGDNNPGWANIRIMDEKGRNLVIIVFAKEAGERPSITRSWHNFNKCRSKSSKSQLGDQDETAYLRLERRGQEVYLDYSLDGREWGANGLFKADGLDPLGKKVCVEVLAGTKGKGEFKATFDQFKLTQQK